jgi:hypothetical protein
VSLGEAALALPPPVVPVAKPNAFLETPAAWAVAPSSARAARRDFWIAILGNGEGESTELAVFQRMSVEKERMGRSGNGKEIQMAQVNSTVQCSNVIYLHTFYHSPNRQ